jgi:hypothetical protein
MSDKKFRLILFGTLALALTWILYKHNSGQQGGFSVTPPDNAGRLSVFELARAKRVVPHQSEEEIYSDRAAQQAFLKSARGSGKKQDTGYKGSEQAKTSDADRETDKGNSPAPAGDLWSYARSWETSEKNRDGKKGSENRWSWNDSGYMSSGGKNPEGEPETGGENHRESDRESGYKNTGDDSSHEKIRVVYTGQSRDRRPGRRQTPDTVSEADILLAMADSQVNEVVGRTDSHGSENLLKMGSEYLGVIRDAIEISTGEKQNLVVDVVGRLSPHTVTQPFKMFVEARLSSNGSRIIGRVKQCIDPASNSRSLRCSGDIKGIDGRDGLRGEIYNPSVWASVVRTAGTLLSQYSLSSMTSSITQGGVILDQSQSNKILQSLSSGWQALGNELASQINSQGKSVSVAGGSIVRILVTEDSELW